MLTNKAVSNGMFSPNWESYVLEAVDGKYISYQYERWFGSPDTASRAVSSGRHNLLIRAEFNRTLGGGGPYQSFIDLPVTIEPNGNYQLNGKVDRNTISVWLEDGKTGRKVSDIASGVFQTKPRDNVVPIIMPAGR